MIPTYLALGDSISIDDYTGSKGGGAASQFAAKIGAEPFIDVTRDGAVSTRVLEELRAGSLIGDVPKIDIVTVTIGGNDLLSGMYFRQLGDRGADMVSLDTLRQNLAEIGDLLAGLNCPVIICTIYDPTDGDDSKASELGLPAEARQALNAANALIRGIARKHGFMLCDLIELFRGHGSWSADPWLVLHIEPNLAGATAIANEWYRLYASNSSIGS